jgi:hypothetical protein
VSIGVNCAIIYWTSDALTYILGNKYERLEQFMIIVLIEHIIIGFKLLLSVVIRDKPDWVARAERLNIESQGDYFELLDDKEDEYKAKGFEPLHDKIMKIK